MVHFIYEIDFKNQRIMDSQKNVCCRFFKIIVITINTKNKFLQLKSPHILAVLLIIFLLF
ncbi:hypothetical protein CAP51_01255 [Acinetobacter populi]|uniref:Uncharacterized protein n=1 Tax=Acinetobacter populi TaxID=1582270 RepID=A0A1Z9Z1B8_9GAMM|nr:hypothetical protein CAP51_01255 [Acinetobacter populi]